MLKISIKLINKFLSLIVKSLVNIVSLKDVENDKSAHKPKLFFKNNRLIKIKYNNNSIKIKLRSKN